MVLPGFPELLLPLDNTARKPLEVRVLLEEGEAAPQTDIDVRPTGEWVEFCSGNVLLAFEQEL